MLDPTDDLPEPSLFRDLAEGRAGIAVRILVALALAVFLVGAGLVVSYGLAAVIPRWNRDYHLTSFGASAYTGVYPRDELIAMVMLLAGGLWVGAVLWLFFKHSRRRALFRPMSYTIGIIASTVALGIWADDSLEGDREYVIAGLCLIGGAGIVLVWIQGIRRLTSGRPLRNRRDQHPDVRCPECGYRMVGLHESRCPECGRTFTLDELIARQGFGRQEPDLRTTAPPPPPVPGATAESLTSSKAPVST